MFVAESFSALQRAEIAEIEATLDPPRLQRTGFSALQRAEIAEMYERSARMSDPARFSALQRAEIAEMLLLVLLLLVLMRFSALQRAEIAEIKTYTSAHFSSVVFQCSSTSRNC